VIIAYAGVQADEADRPVPRLPVAEEAGLAARLRGLLAALTPRLVVGALASGSDLLIVEQARLEACDIRILLPFDAETFKRTSVTPRGRRWEVRYDRLLADLGGRVQVADLDPDADESFYEHNSAMLDYAVELARPDEQILGLVVRPAETDAGTVSDDFANRAARAGITVLDVLTPPPAH
jgi:hypothetical protein